MWPNTEQWEFNIMAIDPGSKCLGVAVYSLNYLTREIKEVKAFTITALDSSYFSKSSAKFNSEKMERIRVMCAELRDALDHYRPGIVACESPFFNSFTPSAYGTLKELLLAIQLTVCEFNNRLPVRLVDPPTAKKAVRAKGNAKKEDMTVAIEKLIADKLIPNTLDVNALDEHSIDAMAIGYWAYRTIT